MKNVEDQQHSGLDDSARPRPTQRRSAARLTRLCLKELRETLRDRRTIVTLVFMPLLVYPLLSIAFQKFAISSASSISQVDIHIGVESENAASRLSWFLGMGSELLRQQNPSASNGGDSEAVDADPHVELILAKDLRQAVANGSVDVSVVMRNRGRQPDETAQRTNGPGRRPFRCQLICREESALSKLALDFVQERLNAVNDAFIRESRIVMPTKFTTENVSSQATSFSLTTLIPLILVLMTITGAVYPAIDVTAGERERGTLETLMAAPVPRLSLLFSKYIAVLTVALFTATANLVSMTVTLVATDLGETVFGEAGLTAGLVAQVFALLILFATFFSAILLAITSFARSFKEAQSYLIPIMLLALAPGMMSLMPDLEFTVTLAVTPLVNIVLLARDIFEGKPDPSLATAAVLSTALYAFAALGLAARIFGADAILYGSQATWSDLMRRPDEPRETATVPAAMFCLAVLFPIYFLVASTLHSFPDVDLAGVINAPVSSLPPISLTTRLIASAVITATVFLGVPLIAAILQRVRLADAFQLRASGWLTYVAAAIFGLTLWPFAYEAFLLSNSSGIELASKLKQVQSWLNRLPDLSPFVLLPCLAITPAVCEELFFRGYLLGAFRKAVRPWTAIVGTAVIFGVFHVVASTLSTERLIPSTLMGIVLGWLCYRTGSVLPGILLHALHNGFLLMIAHYREKLVHFGWAVQEETHLPALWLCGAACFVLVASGLLVAGTSRRQTALRTASESQDEAPAASFK